MTKADLVEQLILRTGMARSAAMETVDGVIDIMAEALSSGETITLRGLATFDVRIGCFIPVSFSEVYNENDD